MDYSSRELLSRLQRILKEEVMPIYEYRCQDCQQTFEEWQEDFVDRQVPCPVCGAKSERIMSSTSFVLKGGGWYTDLYSKPADKPADKPGAAPAPAPAAPKAEAATPCAACTGGTCAN